MSDVRGSLEAAPPRRLGREALMTLGAALVLIPTLIRMVVSIDPMPVWSTDLLVMWIPSSGVGPLGTLVLDLLTIFGAGVVLATTPVHVRMGVAALTVIGAAGVLEHGVRDEAHLIVGTPWIAAMCAGAAAIHLPRKSAARLAVMAAVIGIAAMLGAKAVVQVFIDHPATVASYKATRETFLASHGWSPDSTMAQNYERRLLQPEATGWFGLSNVFGTLAAAWTMALAMAAVHTWGGRKRDWRVPALLALGAVVSGGALALSHSKGAIGSLAVALVATLIVMRFRRRASVLVAAVPLVVLAGVIVRGLVGERIGELSILFRWFYIQGATRIFLDHPVLGIGPAGFKDAYMLAKPPISPEEVSSPHSVFFDWISTLGLVGGAWVAVMGVKCRSIGWMAQSTEAPALATRGEGEEGSDVPRSAALLAIAAVAVAIGASAYFERALLTPEMGIARAFGLLAGMGIAWAVAQAGGWSLRVVEVSLIGAALVVLAHTQIETTLVSPGAAPAAGLMLGLAALPPTRPRCPRANPLAGAAVAAVALVAGLAALPAIWGWSRQLDRATEAVRPIGEALSSLESALPGAQEQADAVAQVAALAGVGMPRQGADLEQAVLVAKRRAALEAMPALVAAVQERPADVRTREAAVRLLAALAGPLGDRAEAKQHAREALAIAREAVVHAPQSAGAWGLLCNTHVALLGLIPEASLDEAIDACAQATALDPHGLNYALKLVDLLVRAGRVEEARAWAGRVLEINGQLRLDPLRQLSDVERARLEELAKG